MTRLFLFAPLLAALSFTTGCTLDDLQADINANSRTANRYGSDYAKKKKERESRPKIAPLRETNL